MVQSLLDFKAKLDTMVTESFGKDPLLLNALKEGFEHFVNSRENKPAEVCVR